jgi:hypothetical protein
MSLLKALKSVDKDFNAFFEPIYHHRVKIEKTQMEVSFNIGYGMDSRSMRIEWFPPQDRYTMLIDLYSETEFILNTWDLTRRTNTWNEDFVIEFDIERSYFDCLPTVYPMTTNFKYEHLAVLKSISQKYVEKKIKHGIK